MGLWDWILNTLVGDHPGCEERPGDGGVAVAERQPAGEPDRRTSPSAGCWWKPEGVSNIEYEPGVCTEPSAEIRAIEETLVSYFDGHDLVMPPFPHAAERVLHVLRDPRCNMPQVARVIAEDQVTAANVLRMANSPLYRGIEKITSLQKAVTRLGSSAIRTLMMHDSLRAAVFGKRAGSDRLVDLVWGGSLASATVMRELATFAALDPEDAFLIGLLHDIGNVIVLRTVTDQERRFHLSVDVRSFEHLCHISHQEFGELIADAWKLPERLKALICDHHRFPAAGDPLRTERLMLIVVDMINQMLGYAPEAQYDLLSTPAVAELGLLKSPRFERCLAQLPSKIEEVTASLG